MRKNLTLDQLKSAFSANESSRDSMPNNYYRFWDMPEGSQAVVRFLPDLNEDNPFIFFVEKRYHQLYINGEKKNIPCLTTYDEECPICAVSSGFYKRDDEEKGKAYWRKRQYLTQAIIVEDPLPPDAATGENSQGKVKCLSLGYQLFNIVKDAVETPGELESVPFNFDDGIDFIIKKSKQGKYSTYVLGSRFARKQRPLTDEEIAEAEANMIDLSTLLPRKPEIEKVESDLAASLNDTNAAVAAGDYSDDNDDTSSTVSVSAARTSVADDDDDTVSDEAEAILAEIRGRKGKAAS